MLSQTGSCPSNCHILILGQFLEMKYPGMMLSSPTLRWSIGPRHNTMTSLRCAEIVKYFVWLCLAKCDKSRYRTILVVRQKVEFAFVAIWCYRCTEEIESFNHFCRSHDQSENWHSNYKISTLISSNNGNYRQLKGRPKKYSSIPCSHLCSLSKSIQIRKYPEDGTSSLWL